MLYDFLISRSLSELYVGSILLLMTILIMLVAAPVIAAHISISNLDYDPYRTKSTMTRKTLLSLLALCLAAVSIVSLFFRRI